MNLVSVLGLPIIVGSIVLETNVSERNINTCSEISEKLGRALVAK